MQPAVASWALRLLDRIEREEVRLLSWGLVDGFFSRSELEDFIDRFGAQVGVPGHVAPDQALSELERLKLLVRLEYPDGLAYRTRMAETTRLLARLRQLFPKHLKGRGWQVAPNLVSDFRIAVRPRVFPRRDVPAAAAIEAIAKKVALDAVAIASLGYLLDANSPDSTQLARFQVDATAQILANLLGAQTSGTIVSAGTGSGKTLAFYLPALAHLASIAAGETWTKVLAIYPRNELLKDQLTETLRAARRLNTGLRASGRRPIRLGAYYGDTPRNNTTLEGRPMDRGQAWTCGFLRCPECDGPMMWTQVDRIQEVETLRCFRTSCRCVVTSDEFAITRKSIQEAPPDIVFSTTEMLNRHLVDSWSCHVFGVGPQARRKPRVMLLDEVHTYEGTSGAQVAYLLRRWQHAVRAPIEFVGLSATLREARAFFSQLTGVREHLVTAIEPAVDDMLHGGMEYLLALRGDPVSGANLLSTTIQAAMLLRRSLDPRERPTSAGTYGSRLFLFTDDLDVTNRLYNDTLDAEAVTRYGAPTSDTPLAALRSPALPDRLSRLLAGQSWDMSEEIGFGLATFRARVGRTSSQDTGVDLTSDVIVATASLEVGFNDPQVGAVIQHKAPRGTAQFLQRKGRAGRTRRMRPWTVVVLSDYGRDRLAYQGYDLLFDPQLEPRSLPLGNRYVMKMQAAYALLDWLAEQAGGVPRGSVWTDLAGPDGDPRRAPYTKKRQVRDLELVDRLLTEPLELERFARFLGDALQVGPDEVESLLWDAPRALVTGVLPTIKRRLATGWRSGVPGRTTDYVVENQPIPDFVPANLFSDLSVPEVDIAVPSAKAGIAPEVYAMPVTRALQEFAPGRVSYRFGIGSSYARHWVAPNDLGGSARQTLDVGAFVSSHDELGVYEYWATDRSAVKVRCLRPWAIQTSIPGKSVADSSNSFLDWRTQILPHDNGATVDLPKVAGWEGMIDSIRFHLHSQHSGVELRRFAIGAKASLAFQKGPRVDTAIDFVARGSADGEEVNVALGYAVDVDGMVLSLQGSIMGPAVGALLSEGQVRSFRSAYFQHRVVHSMVLTEWTNSFERGWLQQLYASAITAEAMRLRVSLAEAHRSLELAGLGHRLREVLDVIFQALPNEDAGSVDGDEGLPAVAGSRRIYDRLVELCGSAQVQASLAGEAPVLWEEPTSEWWAWAEQRLRATLAAAVIQAIQRLCPDMDATNGIVVDLESGPRQSQSGTAEIWLCETVPGGGGVLQRVFARYAEDPRRFFRLIESAIKPSDFELVDAELTRILEWSQSDAEVAACLEAVRSAETQSSLQVAFDRLLGCVQERGAFICHPVVAALNARVLRPASSAATDRLMHALVSHWRSEEERLGVEIDARVFAYLHKDDHGLDLALGAAGLIAPTDAAAWRFGAVYSLLWPRGWMVRAQALSLYNPFTQIPPTDSRLVRELLPRPAAAVSATADTALDREAVSRLIQDGVVALTAPATEPALLRRAILASLATPLDVGYLYLYPRLAAVERSPDAISVQLELGDAPQ